MAGRLLASLYTTAPAVLRDHVHMVRMLSIGAAATSTTQAGLPSSLPPGYRCVATAPASLEAAVSPPDRQDEASDFVREMFRRHNTSLPNLEGQVVVGTVVQADKRSVLIDVGYKSLQRFFRSELANAPIYTRDGGNRGVPAELMVGDLLHFTIRDLDTIFGDMQLDVHTLRPAERADRTLHELERAQETQTPVLERILNSVSRGYAVGLGGVVGFLPMSQCLVRTAQRVGVLQPFMVSAVERKMGMRGTLQPNVVVIDAEKLREDEAFRRKRLQHPLGEQHNIRTLSQAERIQRQRQRQESSGPNAGRRAASAYAMLAKSRAFRQQTSQEQAKLADDGTSAAQS